MIGDVMPIMAILGLGILLACGLLLVAVARRRSSRVKVLVADGIPDPPGGPGYLRPVPMLGHTGEVIEDPLVAAMERTSADRLGDRPGWTSLTPRDEDGADFDVPRWVRRLDGKTPVPPATAHGDRVGRADPNGADSDTEAATSQPA